MIGPGKLPARVLISKLSELPAPLCAFGIEEITYPTIVGNTALAQKKNPKRHAPTTCIDFPNDNGNVIRRVNVPNPIHTHTLFLFSYPPTDVDTNPPKLPPYVGPYTDAGP